jgi:hypothetical protein
MKTMLYIGAALMIGASIYGFVDYEKARHKKEFNNLYKETEVKQPVTDVKNDKMQGIIEKTAPEKKSTALNENKTAPAEKKEMKKAKKKRKVKREFFGRGGLGD